MPDTSAELTAPTQAKIVATIGPASESPDMVRRLIEAGVSVFRLNFSHGTLDEHEARAGVVRSVAGELGRPIALLGDLQGPKVRIGAVQEGGVTLEPGQDVVLRRGTDGVRRDGSGRIELPTTYPSLADEVGPGHRVLINDGAIRMLAVARSEDGLLCRVVVGGRVSTGKGVNLPDTEITLPPITEYDWRCVEWAVGQDLDFLALSFVCRPDEIVHLKDRLAQMCPARRRDVPVDHVARIPVVAKVERPKAVERIEQIVEAADVIMVARGDLGVEMDIAQVPVIQKRILAECLAWNRPSIVATQMLESMIDSATPTRAEASDVAGAVFDGATALMLSAETAIGRHPDLVVRTMSRIIAAAEARADGPPQIQALPEKLVLSRDPVAAIAHGAWQVARGCGARLLVCWSQAGGMARHLSRHTFRTPIIAFSSSARATRRMAMLSGVTAVHAPTPATRSDWVRFADEQLLSTGRADPGDVVVLVSGHQPGVSAANAIAMHRVGQRGGGFG